MSAPGLFVGNQVFSLLDGLNAFQIIAMTFVVAGAIVGVVYGIYKLANPSGGNASSDLSSQPGNQNDNTDSSPRYIDYVSPATSCVLWKDTSRVSLITLNQPFIDYMESTYDTEPLVEGAQEVKYKKGRFSTEQIKDMVDKLVELNPPEANAVVFAINSFPEALRTAQDPYLLDYLNVFYISEADKEVVQDTIQFGPGESMKWGEPESYRILLKSTDLPVLKTKLIQQRSMACSNLK